LFHRALPDLAGRGERVVVVNAVVLTDLGGRVQLDRRAAFLPQGGERLQEPLPDLFVLVGGDVRLDLQLAEVEERLRGEALQVCLEDRGFLVRPPPPALEATAWIAASPPGKFAISVGFSLMKSKLLDVFTYIR